MDAQSVCGGLFWGCGRRGADRVDQEEEGRANDQGLGGECDGQTFIARGSMLTTDSVMGSARSEYHPLLAFAHPPLSFPFRLFNSGDSSVPLHPQQHLIHPSDTRHSMDVL